MSAIQEQIARKTIEEIHLQFDTAQDRLVAEAQAILNKVTVADREMTERLERVGFGWSKRAKQYREAMEQTNKAKSLIDIVNYCKVAYPLYRFITAEQVKVICEKYNLIMGDSYKYQGDIPEKNLCEIEAFKLKKDDYKTDSEMYAHYFARRAGNGWHVSVDAFRHELEAKAMMDSVGIVTATTHAPVPTASSASPAFQIVAPASDFKMNYDDRMEGHILVNDPIVLCPLRGGFLIISKWGLEASDETVINEQHN